jgi:hypothetical protein
MQKMNFLFMREINSFLFLSDYFFLCLFCLINIQVAFFVKNQNIYSDDIMSYFSEKQMFRYTSSVVHFSLNSK